MNGKKVSLFIEQKRDSIFPSSTRVVLKNEFLEATVGEIGFLGIEIPQELTKTILGKKSKELRSIIKRIIAMKLTSYAADHILKIYRKNGLKNCIELLDNYQANLPNGKCRLYNGHESLEYTSECYYTLTNGQIGCFITVVLSYHQPTPVKQSEEAWLKQRNYPKNVYVSGLETIGVSFNKFKKLTELTEEQLETVMRRFFRLGKIKKYLSRQRINGITEQIIFDLSEAGLLDAEKDAFRREERNEVFAAAHGKPIPLTIGRIVLVGNQGYYVKGNKVFSLDYDECALREAVYRSSKSGKPPKKLVRVHPVPDCLKKLIKGEGECGEN
jgi:hypothetical protein